jgi:alkylated DNA repair protein (DNA oxidative demethylase)
MGDLLSGVRRSDKSVEALAEGVTLLKGFATPQAVALMEALRQVVAAAPFRHMMTPGGHRMSVAMTNYGRAGWVTDRSGYRYDPIDPLTQRPWPSMPTDFLCLAARAATTSGFDGFEPDACLINRYEPEARLSLHQDKNERDFTAPIVSVSLGLPAVFLFGGLRRSDRPRRVRLEGGDVAVWGGPARLAFHGIEPLEDGDDPLTGRCRINLTFRKAL